MDWKLQNDLPIYSQLIDRLTHCIVSGVFAVGERLPSVRDLAADAGVNPNTMQRALAELERTGLVYSLRTSGRFVTEDITVIENAKREIAEKNIHSFLLSMQLLGYTENEIIDLLRDTVEEVS